MSDRKLTIKQVMGNPLTFGVVGVCLGAFLTFLVMRSPGEVAINKHDPLLVYDDKGQGENLSFRGTTDKLLRPEPPVQRTSPRASNTTRSFLSTNPQSSISPSTNPSTVASTTGHLTSVLSQVAGSGSVTLDIVQLRAKNPIKALVTLRKYVHGLGGLSQGFSEVSSEEHPDTTGLLLYIPPASLSDAIRVIGTQGHILDQQHWTGNQKDRQQRLLRPSLSKIDSLVALKEDLLKTYKPDELPVVDVESECARINKLLSLLSLAKGSEQYAVIKVCLKTPS